MTETIRDSIIEEEQNFELMSKIVRDKDGIFKRPFCEADRRLLLLMREEANLYQSLHKHDRSEQETNPEQNLNKQKYSEDPIIIERKRILKSRIDNLRKICKQLDEKYNVK
jgi:hypothetical protein